MKILFLSSWFPYPANNGSKIRVYNLLKGLSTQHEVSLLAFYFEPPTEEHCQAIRGLCQSLSIIPKREFRPGSFKAAAGLFSGMPRSWVDTYSLEMEQQVQRISQEQTFDIVIISEMGTLPYQRFLTQYPTLLEDTELGALYDIFAQNSSTLASRIRTYPTWLKTTRYIKKSLQQAQACTVVSEREKILVQKIAPSNFSIEVIPNCIDLKEYPIRLSLPQPATILFTGSLVYSANEEAVGFFIHEIFPIIQKSIQDVQFLVSGNPGNSQLPARVSDPNIRFLGYVSDIRTLIAQSCVCVVPLRIGGGTRFKILEALALGTPVISTSKGAEGLEAKHEEHILIGDTPQEFAQQTIRLLQDAGLQAQLAQRGRHLVEENYDWKVVMPGFLALVDRLAHKDVRK